MKQERINEIKGILLVAFTILVFVSLLSYNPKDLSFFSFPQNMPVRNFAGIIGAYIAGILFFLLGFASYIIPILTVIWALGRFWGKLPQRFYIKVASTAILFIASSSLLSMIAIFASQTIRLKAGGIVGLYFSDVLYRYFGRVGAFVIVGTLLSLSLILATEFVIMPYLVSLLKKIFAPFGRISLGRKPEPEAIFNRQRQQRKEQKPKEVKPSVAPQIQNTAKPEKPVKTAPIITIQKKPEAAKSAPKPKPIVPKPARILGDYKLPGIDLLDSPPPVEERKLKEDLENSSRVLEDTLADFGIEAKVVQVDQGPTITIYELEPAPGVKVNRIVALSDDIALTMKAHSVRIVAPIPGKSRVGIEVPNMMGGLVYLREVMESDQYNSRIGEMNLPLVLGKDVSGNPILADLKGMPHLLIAGTTGSGKTVCVNSVITSFLYKFTPDECKFLMIDPKMVEMAVFNGLPHLICPVVTEPKKVSAALAWVVSEMERRYKLLAKMGARNIGIYNKKVSANSQKQKTQDTEEQEAVLPLPYIVVIIDELADLMMIASQDIENAITRLAQLSRAVGIHMILATQRPSVDVITGVIKANFPARISFKVASKVDSRTVLDMNGADKLLGKGDMLFLKPGTEKPIRGQGTLISDAEIERVVNFVKTQGEPEYDEEMLKESSKKLDRANSRKDELFEEAARMIVESGQASVSMLQRRLGLGYTRAARLIDAMEEEGIVGPFRGSKPREILVDGVETLNERLNKE